MEKIISIFLYFVVFNFIACEAVGYSSISSFGDNVYTFYTEMKNISQANSTCNKFQGFLAHVKNEETQNFINQHLIQYKTSGKIKKDGFWIGLHQISNNQWQWSDTSSIENYANWYSEASKPRKSKSCSAISTSIKGSPIAFGHWTRRKCFYKNRYICQNKWGILSKKTLQISDGTSNVTCIASNSSFLVRWEKDNTAISSEGDSVYQEYEDHTTYKISTLYFTNPLRKDAGRYDCLILSREGDQHPRVAAALTATLEAKHGDGYLSSNSVTVREDVETVNCTIYGGPSFNATWKRNGIEVTNNKQQRFYQLYNENEEFKILSLKFVSPLKEDEGPFYCVLKENRGNSNSIILQELSLVLKTESFINDMESNNDVNVRLSETISCSVRGRPIPKISWTVGYDQLLRNDKIFSITSTTDENSLTSNSTITILNPISFSKQQRISCKPHYKSEEKRKTFYLNSDVRDLYSGLYSRGFYLSLPANKCSERNGVYVNTTGGQFRCDFIVASLQQSQDIEEICEETEMKIQFNDFTFSTPQPQLTVYVYTGYSNLKSIEVREPTINLNKLKPKTSYTIKVVYQPTYWNKYVTIGNKFTTKEFVPESIELLSTELTESGDCKVKFNLPNNVPSYGVNKIKLNITHYTPSKPSQRYVYNKEIKFTKTHDYNTFTFKRYSKDNIYKFTASLLSCGGTEGITSTQFECLNNPGTGSISQNEVTVGKSTEFIDCLIYGNSSFNATWKRNGIEIPTTSQHSIYQVYEDNIKFKKATINFVNPLKKDEGSFECFLLKKDESGSLRTLEILTATLKTELSTKILEN